MITPKTSPDNASSGLSIRAHRAVKKGWHRIDRHHDGLPLSSQRRKWTWFHSSPTILCTRHLSVVSVSAHCFHLTIEGQTANPTEENGDSRMYLCGEAQTYAVQKHKSHRSARVPYTSSHDLHFPALILLDSNAVGLTFLVRSGVSAIFCWGLPAAIESECCRLLP